MGYSAFEAGTRVPFIVSWPGSIATAVSPALISQIDFLASFSALLKVPIAAGDARDSKNIIPALLGHSKMGNEIIIEQGGALSIVQGNWKYIEPNNGLAFYTLTEIESGNDPNGQLYDLQNDIGERNNLIKQQPEKAKSLAALLAKIKAGN